MGGAPWVVHEGYVLCRPPDGAHKLLERYAVLYVNRKLEFFEAAPPPLGAAGEQSSERRRVGDALFVSAFAGWDGDGLLKAGEAYGLELRVDPKPHGSGRRTTSLCVAAFNRVDLEKWCRALVAALDPQSAPAEEVRRERRRVRREEKRLEQEREEKLRRWRDLKRQQAEEERERQLAREAEISNMTPLERVDGLGSLDDDTARLLEKRRLRLQRRHAPTTGRVNKAAYRKRMEEGAGGKLENVQPLQPKVVETKARARVELPLPGQFFEATDVSATHRIGLPTSSRGAAGSSSSDSSLEHPSDTSSASSHSHLSSSHGHRMSFVPPPPPPPHALIMKAAHRESSSSDFVPPPPPPPPAASGFIDVHRDGARLSRAQSFRSSLYDDEGGDGDHRLSEAPRSSFSQSQRRLSGVDRAKYGVQDNLAAILSGRKPSTGGRRDSVTSATSELSTMRNARKKTSDGAVSSSPEPPPSNLTNAFAASLAAIRLNRTDTMDDTTNELADNVRESGRARNRKRETQLSAEGKELLKKAITGVSSPVVAKSKAKTNGRKGLFDDSSSSESDESDSGLFASGKQKAQSSSIAAKTSSKGNGNPHNSTTPASSLSSSVGPRRANARGFARDDDDDASDITDASRSEYGEVPGPLKSAGALVSRDAGVRQAATVSVAYVSSVVQNEGKKPAGFYTFAFRVGALEHQFTHSYNELEAIHVRLASEFKSDALPKFPSKHRLRNNTKPENMHKRALEFVEYLQQLVVVPGILESQRFWFEFHLDDRFRLALSGEGAQNAQANSSAGSRLPDRSRVPVSPVENPPTNTRLQTATKASKQLFGMDDDSDSDGDDSDSDTSVSVPTRMQPSRSRGASSETQSARKANAPSKKEVAELEPPPSRKSARRPSSTASRAPSESPAPAPPAAAIAPKITGLPPRPNLFGGGRGDLLAAIRKGTELRKTDDSPDPVVVSGGGGKAALLAPKASPPASAPTGSISDAITNAMAARRIHVEYEEAQSDEEDSDDDWD